MAESSRGAVSGWQPDFRPAAEQWSAQRHTLKALIGRTVVGAFTAGDPGNPRLWPPTPLVLAVDGGPQLEIAWQGWADLSVTRDTVDLAVPPEAVWRTWTWMATGAAPGAALAGRTITAIAATESPYFDGGDVDPAEDLPMDKVKGWTLNGLWIECGGIGLNVFNGADQNGYAPHLLWPEWSGPRVAHRL